MRGELPLSVVLGVKEIVSLPREVIEDRFNLEGDQGTAIEYLGGEAVPGIMGAGFIYTNKDTLSVGLGCPLHALKVRKKTDLQPRDLLNAFKLHPCVRPLLRGTKPEEYSAHLIPELSPEDLPSLVTDGLVVVGGAAGIVNANPLFHEGTDMTMASGLLAAGRSSRRIRTMTFRRADSSRTKSVSSRALLGKTCSVRKSSLVQLRRCPSSSVNIRKILPPSRKCLPWLPTTQICRCPSDSLSSTRWTTSCLRSVG